MKPECMNAVCWCQIQISESNHLLLEHIFYLCVGMLKLYSMSIALRVQCIVIII